MALVEEISWKSSRFDSSPINLEITSETDNEHLREIGAIGSLLIELIRENCGPTGQITVEETPDGVRIRVDSDEQKIAPFAHIGGV
ncbi:MAG: hypothetical protein ACFFDP_01000 [Promethearchaeota archaeon]